MIWIGIAALVGLQLPQLYQLQANRQSPEVAQIRQAEQAEKLKLGLLQQSPSLGFDNLIADWTFLNFLQYFGDRPARQKTDYKLSPDYFGVILKRDPYFLQVYPFLSTSASMYAGMPERSTDLMKRALQSLKPNVPSDSYFAWRQLAIDQLLFNGDAAAARQSFEIAANWAAQSKAPGSQAIARFSQQTADFLATNSNSKSAQVAAWAMLLSNAPDEQTQQTAAQRIEALGGSVVKNPDGTFSVRPPAKD